MLLQTQEIKILIIYDSAAWRVGRAENNFETDCTPDLARRWQRRVASGQLETVVGPFVLTDGLHLRSKKLDYCPEFSA